MGHKSLGVGDRVQEGGVGMTQPYHKNKFWILLSNDVYREEDILKFPKRFFSISDAKKQAIIFSDLYHCDCWICEAIMVVTVSTELVDIPSKSEKEA